MNLDLATNFIRELFSFCPFLCSLRLIFHFLPLTNTQNTNLRVFAQILQLEIFNVYVDRTTFSFFYEWNTYVSRNTSLSGNNKPCVYMETFWGREKQQSQPPSKDKGWEWWLPAERGGPWWRAVPEFHFSCCDKRILTNSSVGRKNFLGSQSHVDCYREVRAGT